MEVADMRMGVTTEEKTRNERIRWTSRVGTRSWEIISVCDLY